LTNPFDEDKPIMKTQSKLRQRGALMIELVLTLPILLAVIFAIVEYSVLLGPC
jgi:Flp pilus assembly protein TadG